MQTTNRTKLAMTAMFNILMLTGLLGLSACALEIF
jgi:hypothetical protein